MKTPGKLVIYALIIVGLGITSCSKEEEQVTTEEEQGTIAQTAMETSPSKNALTSKRFLAPEGSLHLGTMLDNFKSKKRYYLMNVSTTAIMKDRYTFPMVGYCLDQPTYWEVGSSGYWRADCRIKRSDSGFGSRNHFEVLVYPKPSNPNLVDENQIKLTWRSPELGLHTFLLQNVSVHYVPNGILINGSYRIKGTPIGVSIGITPK